MPDSYHTKTLKQQTYPYHSNSLAGAQKNYGNGANGYQLTVIWTTVLKGQIFKRWPSYKLIEQNVSWP